MKKPDKSKLAAIIDIILGIAVLIVAFVCTIYALNATASSSFGNANSIYLKIVRSNGLFFAPRLYLSPSKEKNASSSFNRIVINQGMLNAVRNKHELALVLGHELAHWALMHGGSSIPKEYSADALGARFMTKAGYNVCIGSHIFDILNATHPSNKSRSKKLC